MGVGHWQKAAGHVPGITCMYQVYPFSKTICNVYGYIRIVLEHLVRTAGRDPPSFRVPLDGEGKIQT